jgi:catecholate siderophore receptor
MRTIQSRKHAADHAPRHRSTLALAAAAFALPGAVLAQAAAPAAAASQPRGETTLPTVKVQAAAPENDYKADVVSSPKFTQAIVDTPQTITVIKKELLQQEQATTLTEALRNTPGVTLQLGENGSTQTSARCRATCSTSTRWKWSRARRARTSAAAPRRPTSTSSPRARSRKPPTAAR